jgi:transposase
MRKIREVLRLRFEHGLCARDVAKACGLGCTTVLEYGYRAKAAGLVWPPEEEMTDAALEALLFPPPPPKDTDRPLPDYKHVREELGRPGVTLALVWSEYKKAHPNGYRYSRFVELYREWEGNHSYSMIQTHRPGEKLFVDFAGMKMHLSDPRTGEVTDVEIFVAATGFSQLIYVRACLSQSLRDWLDCHVLAFEFLGGTPEVLVPDNLKSGVKSACRYDPEKNPSYADLAHRYGIIVLPARAHKPRDKPKVENGVLQVERWVLAPLRDRVFFSLPELQHAMDPLVAELNDKKLSDVPFSRRELFELEEKPKLSALPASRYEFAQWKKAKVGPDYHVRFESHAYSVHHRFCGKTVDIRLTSHRVEVYLDGVLVAGHDRGISIRYVNTLKEHMPESHREYAEWTPERLTRWASEFGPCTAEFVRVSLERYEHPEHGFRPAFGIVGLAKKYGDKRLEKACARALRAGASRYHNVKSILERGLDQLDEPTPEGDPRSATHENVRGADYFGSEPF